MRVVLLNVAVVVCWIVLWVGTILMPLGVASSALLRWWRRDEVLFLLSAILNGLVITLWPFLFPSNWG